MNSCVKVVRLVRCGKVLPSPDSTIQKENISIGDTLPILPTLPIKKTHNFTN